MWRTFTFHFSFKKKNFNYFIGKVYSRVDSSLEGGYRQYSYKPSLKFRDRFGSACIQNPLSHPPYKEVL